MKDAIIQKHFDLSGHVNSVLSSDEETVKAAIYTEWPDDKEAPEPFKINDDVKNFLRTSSHIYCRVHYYPFKEVKEFRYIVNDAFGKEEITEDDFIKILKVFVRRFRALYNKTPESESSFHDFRDFFFEGILLLKSDVVFVNDGYMYFRFGS